MSDNGASSGLGDQNRNRNEKTRLNIDGNGSRLHLTFVEFLFSLAAAEVAVRFASVFDEKVGWQSLGFLALASHLSMALLLIAASYIGWSSSSSSHRDTSQLTTVFSWDFVELMLDVTLVITYFVLVHLSEEPEGDTGDISASMVHEAICVSAIFLLYLVWDIVSKLPFRKYPKGSKRAGETYGRKVLFQRAWVGTRDLDSFLTDKDAVTGEFEEQVRQRAGDLGLEIVSVGVRDVILPGDMKDLMNKVTEAKKAAEANLIARREETAAMRSQANTARLLADNPTLMRLRELEVLEKVAATGDLKVVLGEKGLADRVVNLL